MDINYKVWVNIAEANHPPMQKSFKRRFPLFFQEGTFEIHVQWDHERNQEGSVTINHS